MTDDLVKRLREDQPVTQDMTSTLQCALQDAAADRIEALEAKLNWVIVERDETFALMLDRAQTAEAKLAKAVEALRECEEEIDQCVRFEYPHDHPVQERYRQRGFAANPARTTLAELTGGKDD